MSKNKKLNFSTSDSFCLIAKTMVKLCNLTIQNQFGSIYMIYGRLLSESHTFSRFVATGLLRLLYSGVLQVVVI